MVSLREMQEFDLYENHSSDFDVFVDAYFDDLQGFLESSINNSKRLYVNECLNTSPEIDIVISISQFCTIEATYDDTWRREFRSFAREFDKGLFTDYEIDIFADHWRNVTYYVFMIVYLRHVEGAGSKMEC